MAPLRKTALLLTTTAVVSCLQVAPNSPCTAVCAEAPFATNGVCTDAQFDAVGSKGEKVKNCLSCLQESTFTEGTESDQSWFIHHIRYAFDYCVFGYPNATDIGSNPCMTSEACGPLRNSSLLNTPGAVSEDRLRFCDVTGKFQKDGCQQCIKADGYHNYASNFFIALEAACQQRPPPDNIIGLNSTVFTPNTIQPFIASASPSESKTPLSVGAIIGVVLGSIAFMAIVASGIFVYFRKRNAFTLSSASKDTESSPPPQSLHYEGKDPSLHEDYDDDRFFVEKSPDQDYAEASMSPVARSKPFVWDVPLASDAQVGRQLNITTTLPVPEPAYTSPKMGMFSPDDFTPPTSTVSTRSSMPLLRHKASAISTCSASPVLMGSPVFKAGSPKLTQTSFQAVSPQDGQVGKDSTGRKNSMAQISRIQTAFPPPPTG